MDRESSVLNNVLNSFAMSSYRIGTGQIKMQFMKSFVDKKIIK